MDRGAFRLAWIVTTFGAAAAGIAFAGWMGSRLAAPDSTALIEVGMGGDAAARLGHHRGAAPLGDYRDPIVDRSLFDSDPAPPAGPGATDLPARLLATSTAEQPRYSSALIAVSGGDADVYAVGDTIADAVIERIDRERVTVRRSDGRQELLRLGTGGNTGRVPATANRPRPAAGKTDWAAGIESLGDGRYRLDRSVLGDAIANLDDLGKGLHVAPNFKDGKAAGYRLLKFRKDSPLSLLGLERNDVIVGVDGNPVDPAVALDLLGRIDDLDRLEIQIHRGGEPVDLVYEVD